MLGHAGHRLVGIRDRFQTAILSVRSTGLESHHVRLSGRVHDRQGHLETVLIDSVQYFQADAAAVFDARPFPRVHSGQGSRHEDVQINSGIGDAELRPERRDFFADGATRARLIDGKGLVEPGVESGLAVGFGRLTVDFAAGDFRVRAPEGAVCDGRDCPLKRLAMLLVKRMAHR